MAWVYRGISEGRTGSRWVAACSNSRSKAGLPHGGSAHVTRANTRFTLPSRMATRSLNTVEAIAAAVDGPIPGSA